MVGGAPTLVRRGSSVSFHDSAQQGRQPLHRGLLILRVIVMAGMGKDGRAVAIDMHVEPDSWPARQSRATSLRAARRSAGDACALRPRSRAPQKSRVRLATRRGTFPALVPSGGPLPLMMRQTPHGGQWYAKSVSNLLARA